jgi:hypothetical protein
MMPQQQDDGVQGTLEAPQPAISIPAQMKELLSKNVAN